MSPTRESAVFVVGAGFSLYAGMPLQMDFTDALLSGRGSASGNSGRSSSISENSLIGLLTIRPQPKRSFGLNWKTSSPASTFLLTLDITWDRSFQLPN